MSNLHRNLNRVRTALVLSGLLYSRSLPCSGASGEAILSLRYDIVATQLQVTPAALTVPKGVAGSVLVQLTGADGSTNSAASSLGEGAFVEAILRGPAFPARRVLGQLNQALLLPPLNLVGDYSLDSIRLVDAVTGAVRMEATPSSVPVHVFDEVLVSKVTSRPLTLDEIKEKGIVIDEQNFRVVEFEVAFVLEGKTIPIRFPVVSPTFKQSTEIIPTAELEEKLAAAQAINREIQASTELPPELQTSGFHIQVQGINMQRVDLEEQDLALQIPPIPALMVIPGNIGYLNQFFSVQIFTENGAPQNSGLSVLNVQATLVLPPGPDRIGSTNYSAPGDDPLRFARVGPDKIIQPTQPVVRPGADGKTGTQDDIPRLYPGESGHGEFLVEGLQEGLHVMDLDLTADLEGLAAGVVKIKGKAAGSVLVRNPKFSMAFSHPRTIRAGEPYDAFVTILNTSQTIANLASITLPAAGLRGGVLESPETVQFETILPGQSVTARYRIRSQRTGTISFSNLTTGDDSVQGRFRLSMGIDERGVILSPDTIIMPDYVNFLPASLINAANRVLGQALSVSTAPQLPPSVKPVARNIVTRRVLELAEAGQRIRYGDSLSRVLSDLLLDWQGARNFSEGFDQIMRETDAGAEFRAALMNEWEGGDGLNAAARLVERAPDLAGRGESWHLAASGETNVEIALIQGATSVTLEQSGITQSLAYRGERGHFLAASPSTNGNRLFRWQVKEPLVSADLVVVLVQSNGIAQRFTWTLTNPPPGSCYSFLPADGSGSLLVDFNCDGTNDATFSAARVEVPEAPPSLITVFQDTSVQAGRPPSACVGDGSILNYGTVLSVLYSKPMTSNAVNNPTAYRFEDGNVGGSVQIQPGGRVALINMRNSFSALRPRTLTISGVTDPRGNPLSNPVRPVISTLTQGISLRGRVVRVDSSPAIGVPVTLTMHDGTQGANGCVPSDVRVAQVFTDANGYFHFDFILYGVPYTIAATDTSGLSPELVTQLLNSGGEAFSRENLLQLASQSNNELLAEFTGGRLPGAIAAVEGVDRAVLRDAIPVGSPRVGSEVPVALRFRGRGTVLGQVLSADGVIPAAQVAVNLFPDPDSRELGRGLFTDNNGRFAFNGVPLGRYSIKAQRGEEPLSTLIGELTQLGEITNVVMILNAINTNVTRTAMRGRVFETDNVTPHPRARVFVGHLNSTSLGDLVAAVDADAEGFWSADGIPLGTWDVLAISFDGKRKAFRSGIGAIAGVISHVNLTLQGLATVSGRVETSTGLAVSNAIVAGGESLVRTDASGLFTLAGVPTGTRTLSAGQERNPDIGVDFPRFGSTSLNVLPGTDNFVVIRLGSAGRIVGRVLDANGTPVPLARVSIPMGLGFRWVNADAQGNYRFENMALGDYTLSAPAPPAQNTDTAGLLSKIRDGSEEDIQAAIGEAFAIFTGAGDPYLNGEGAKFNPGSWGFTQVRINFDGQTVVRDVQFLREGTIAGTVLNGQGVPIGARVRLTGLGPLANGAPGVVIRGERNSDPALGTFAFNGQLLVGDWTLQAASPFYPVVITESGRTSSIDTDETNVVLQFPLIREVEGRLTGTIFNPDGTRAGSGVQVKINFGSDYVLTTDTNGFFDTQIKIPAGSYTLKVNDPASGLVAISSASVSAGIVNVANVTLLGEGGLNVQVFKGDGTPATNAAVEITQGSYPNDHFEGTTDTNGMVQFSNIFEGHYAVSAQMQSGPTRVFGRTAAIVPRGQTATVRIDLTPTGTIRGIFVKADLVTPISFAQVAIGDIGFATTDTNGLFEVGGIPLGTYRLTAKDAVTGRLGINTTTLSFDGEIKEVHLVEQIQFRGEIFGKVLDIFGTGVVAGAAVTLNSSDPLGGPRTMTTGSDGRFSFPDALPGSFSLTAIDPETQFPTSKSATLPDRTSTFEIDILLQPVASVSGTIYQPDGVTPATNATVQFSGLFVDTDEAGGVSFTRLRLGNYVLRANSRAAGQTRSIGETNILITVAGVAPEFAVILRGVGSVAGQVFESDRVTPVLGAAIRLELQSQFFQGQSETKFTDLTGHYSFDNIPIGNYRLVAQSLSLAANFSGTISNHFETNLVNLYLGDNGTITGQLVRRDGTTPVSGVDVVFTFSSQSGNPGRAVDRTDTNGVFIVEDIPVGAFDLEAISLQFDGIAFRSGTLSSNAQVLNLGAIPFDEDDPRVISLVPANGAAGVPITTPIELVFNEALAAGTVTYSGIYLRSPAGIVPGSVQLLADPTNGILSRVRIIPNNPLVSLTTYEIIGIDGERRNASGNITGLGITDLVGRPLVRPFISSFTTADNDPPQLVSVFPTNSAVQIDPRAVMRLSFNEAIQESNFTFTVTGPSGSVTGIASVGLNGLVLIFTPDAALQPNSSYTLNASGVRDLAGNLASNQPYSSTFATLDTIGPAIGTMRLVNNQAPVAGAVVQVEAILTTTEPGVNIRFTQDLNSIGLDTAPPFRASVTLPPQGSTTLRAIARDRFGNDGPFAELVVNVVSNEPPVIQLVQTVPPNGPVRSGQTLNLQVSATDDYRVTNVQVTASGVFNETTNFSSGALRTLVFTVPTNASVGTQARFTAVARDALGLDSAPVTLNIDILDGTAPSLNILSPANDTVLDPDQPLDLVVRSSDNSTNHLLELIVSGALASTQTVAVATPANLVVTNHFFVSLSNAPLAGGVIQAQIRAIDESSNVTVVSRTFRLPDFRAPQLVSANPTNNSIRQSLWLDAVAFDFDEPLEPATATTNNVVVTNNADEATPFTVSLANGNRSLLVALQRPLIPGTTYTNTLLPGLSDGSSNRWRNLGGAAVASEGVPFIFTTADILEVTPTNGAPVVPGQRLNARVNFDPGLGASFFRFRMNANAPVDVPVSGSSSNAAALMQLGIDAATATLTIEAHRSGQPFYPVDTISLNVRPRSADDDSDGMTNGFEADFNLNPFDPADAPLDADGDTLSNLQEHNLGTSPVNPDTDGDGLRDNLDPDPLDPADALRPTVLTFDITGIANAQNVNQNYGDRVTNNMMGNFSYGGLDPFTPNVRVSYGSIDPALWRSGYGALTNVLFEDADSTGVLTVQFLADAGFMVNLHRFDLAAYTTAFGSDPLINSVQVLDYFGNTLFATNNVRISRTNFTQFAFSPALSENALTIRINALNLGSLNDDIAVDNIRFSQSGAEICGVALPDLISSWRAENDASDSTGTNHGVLQNGVTFVAGRVGNAFSFDGVDDYIAIPSSPDLKPTSEITVEGWINLRVIPPGQGGTVAAKGIDAETPLDWALVVTGSGRLRPLLNLAGSWIYFDGNTVLSTGVWHHVSMVYDGSSIRSYLDGQLDGFQPFSGNIQTSDGSFRIGAYAPVNGTSSKAFFPGAIDELRFYSRALTSNEIADISVAGSIGDCPPDQDTDGDGMPDAFELLHRLNPHVNDTLLDPDHDGLSNWEEFQGGTFPRNPDTDGDGMSDGFEVLYNFDPLTSGSLADSVSEFSGVQGSNNWFYGYFDGPFDGSEFLLMTNFSAGRWTVVPSAPPWTLIEAQNMHPNEAPYGQNQWAVRRWISEKSGTLVITGRLARADSGGNGVIGRILVDGRVEFTHVLAGSDTVGRNYSIVVTNVHAGSAVDFTIDANGDVAFDSSVFTARVGITEASDDADGDGLSNLTEFQFGSNPRSIDSDGDGMSDFFEWAYGLNPKVNDTLLDPDGDGLNNQTEFQLGTNPRNVDSDGDGIDDAIDPRPTSPNQSPIAGTDPVNHSLRLDGIDDFVGFGNWFTYQTFTIGMWLKAGSSQVTYADIFDNNHQGGINWVIQQDASTVNQYYWGLSDGSPGILFNLIPNQWQNLVITRDSNRVNKVYLDGNLIGLTTGSGPINYDGAQFLRMGRWGYGGRNWNGLIDHFAIWSNALPAQVVQENMARMLAASETNLVGLWTFNESGGLQTSDVSGNGRNGTLGGGDTNSAPARTPGLDISTITITSSVLHVAIQLPGSDPEGDPVTAQITKLPLRGQLYQTSDGLTRGPLITNVPTLVTDSVRRVLYAPPRGFTTNDLFRYRVSDGFDQSEDALRFIKVTGDPLADLDGDGMPDSFEGTNQFDPEVNDASLDADADGLTNLQEFQRGTFPRDSDSDNDGLSDGVEVASGCLNPLSADTDGDGLNDGIDPTPCTVTSGLTLTAPATFDLVEGATTNLTVRVASTNSQILLLDYSTTNRPPAFVSVKSRSFSNTPTNGVASFELEFNPLHDAAGEHVITLRAAAVSGETQTIDITLTVQDNPALAATRWKDPVDGNWSDASKWSDGLPGAGKVAVIDAAGSYTVNLDTSVAAAGIVLNDTNAVLRVTTSPTIDAPLEVRQGLFSISTSTTLTLNRPLVNHDRLRWVTRYNTFNLQGSGRVENLGLWELYKDPLNDIGSESIVGVPVNVPAGGKLLLSTNALVVFTQPSRLSVGGELEIQAGARLRMDTSSPPPDLTLLAGGQITGAGTLKLEGNCRLVLNGDHVLDQPLQLDGGCSVTGIGRLLVASNQSLVGTFRVPVEVLNNATVNFGSATFNTNVTVAAGGTMTVNSSATISLNTVLTNQGTLRWVTRYNTFNLQGSGRVENLGLWELYKDPLNDIGSESIVGVPVNVPAGGKLLLSTNALVVFTQPSTLTVAGELEIQQGARLRLDGSAPARDLTLLPGAQWTGAGLLKLEGSCRLVLSEDTTVPGGLQMDGGTAVSGAGRLTLAGVLSLVGNFNVPLRLAGNAVVNFGSATFNSNVTVVAGGTMTVNSSATITLNTVLTNLGTLRWVTRYNTFNLQGSGRVENAGLWELFKDPAGDIGSESTVRVPVNVAAGGRLLLSTNAMVNFTQPSSLTVEGELEVQAGARLRLDASNPARDLTLLSGSVLNGTGTVRLEGNCRLVTSEDLDTPVVIDLVNPAQLMVPGTYTVRTSRSISGTVQSATVVVASNATLTASSATFTGLVQVEDGGRVRLNGGTVTFQTNVLVAPGARLDADGGGTTVQLHGVLTNAGSMRWLTRYNTFDLQGSGRVENVGLWELFKDPIGDIGTESTVRVPVNVPAGGRLLLSANAMVNFTQPSSLTVEGELEVQAGARLRLDGSSPARDLTLLPGALWTGVGLLKLDGNCRLVLGQDTIVPGALQMEGATAVAGTGRLTLAGAFSLVGNFNVPLDLSSNAVVNFGSATFNSNVTVMAGGMMTVNGNAGITLNTVLTNLGTLRWVTRYNTFDLQGSGRVENVGLWELFKDLAGDIGSESTVRVPVNVPAGGRLLLSTNAMVNFTQPSSLTVEGELEVQAGARLRLDGSNPARDLTLSAGSVLSGTGTVRLEGNCRLVTSEDLDTTVEIEMLNPAQLIVPGTYTVRTSRSVSGTVQSAAVVVASNATLTASSATFSGLVQVEDGGRVRLNGGTVTFQTNVMVSTGGRLDADVGSPTVNLNGVLTNRGAMKWITRYNTFNLQGSGRVENLGLWELFKDPAADFGGESVVGVPVNVPAGGKLLLSTNALVVFTQPSSLTVEGELEVQAGARLRLDSSAPARDLTLASGSSLNGTGTVLLEGANRVALSANVTWGIGLLDMTGSSTITGAFTLTVSTGSILRYNHSSTIPGSVTVDGTLQLTSSSVTLIINGLLTLNASGTLNNPGTVQVGIGEFINNGGTIIGNPPQEIGGTSTAPQISGIQLLGLQPGSLQKAQASLPPREVLISWTGPGRQTFVIETSTDLGRWKDASATITEIAPGSYQGRLTMPVEAQQFFRVRLVLRDPPERRFDRPYHPR